MLPPSPPLPAPTALSPTLLAPDHASSGTARTQPTGKLAHGARWNRKRLLGSAKSSLANHHFHKTFWWLVQFTVLLVNLICGFGSACSLFVNCFVAVWLNACVCICVCNSARRPAGQEWWSAEWSVWPPKANRPNTAVLQKDLSLKLHVRTENVSQTPSLL